MPAIVFRNSDGSRVTVDATDGESAMMVARNHDIDGVLGECGGNAACATCHVYVDPAYLAFIPPAEPFEEQMLEATASERRENSRLSCQIIMSGDLDGIELGVPETQI